MPQITEQSDITLLIDQSFDDADALNEASGQWQTELRQLESGPTSVHLLQAQSPSTLLLKTRYDQSFYQRGANPADMTTFGIMHPDAPAIDFCGYEAKGSTIERFEESGSYEALSPPGFAAIGISVSNQRLGELAELLELDGAGSSVNSHAGVIDSTPHLNKTVWAKASPLLDELEPDTNNHQELYQLLEHELPLAILTALSKHEATSTRPSVSARSSARRMAMDYFEQHKQENPDISTVCKSIGVSWRLLNYAFAEYLGVTPKAYLKLIRLDGLRKELQHAQHDTTVTDAALNWGFTHFGQLAKDYKNRFGELPSETLGDFSGNRYQ